MLGLSVMLVADGYDKQRNGTKDTETTGSDEDVHGSGPCCGLNIL